MNDLRAVLLDRFVAERPDAEAWQALVLSCREEHGRHADLALSAHLSRKLAQIEKDRRETVVAAVADVLAHTDGARLVPMLAADAEEAARQLALELIGRLSGPLPPELPPLMRGLFLDRRLSETAQLNAAAVLLHSLDRDSAEAADFIKTLVSGLGKARKIKRLRKLEKRVGKSALLDAMCERLEEKLKMSCPRCQVEMRRPDMLRHLWDEHKLLLVGRSVREPWSLLEEWLRRGRAGRTVDLADRCRNLAQHLDPDHGLLKVNRMILARGLDDAEARQFLLEEADEQHASLCPRCFGLVPIPRETQPWTMTFRKGRLSAHGYLVDVSDRGLRTRLEVRTPARQIYLGHEPGYLWTLRGSLFALVGPFVFLGLACALGVVEWAGSPLAPVVWFLSLGLLVYGVVRWDLRDRPPLDRRALTYAWTILTPRLHENRFVADDASFLAALADLEDGDDEVVHRAAVLPRLLTLTEEALVRGEARPSQLAALYLRQVADKALAGANVEDEVAALVGRCFEGKLPLAFADRLLIGWRKDWGRPGAAARLRILVCDRAFEAGFEVRTLLDAGQTAPALGELLRLNNPRELAALRLLWSLRPSRPWERCGPVQTVFELAGDPGNEARLVAMPDMLFFQMDRHWPAERNEDRAELPFRVVVRVSGLQVQDELFAEAPAAIRLKGRLDGSELIVGSKHFHSSGDLEDLAKRVEAWSWFFFTTFSPKLAEVLNWQPPQTEAQWRAWGAVACPECGRPALPRVGEMAVLLEGEKRPSLSDASG